MILDGCSFYARACQEAARVVVDEDDEVPPVRGAADVPDGHARGSSGIERADCFSQADGRDALRGSCLHPHTISAYEAESSDATAGSGEVRAGCEGVAGHSACVVVGAEQCSKLTPIHAPIIHEAAC